MMTGYFNVMNLFYSLPVFMKWYYFVLQRQSCRIVKFFSVHVTHVITLHTCRSSFGFYIWQINLKNIPVVFVSNFAGFHFMNIPESKMHLLSL